MCVFCDIASGKIGAKVAVDRPIWLAVHDINPQAPTHIVVFPKAHEDRLAGEYPEGGLKTAWHAQTLLSVVTDVAEGLGIKDYRVVINNGPGAGQQVMHLHAHILAGWKEGEVPGLVPAPPSSFTIRETFRGLPVYALLDSWWALTDRSVCWSSSPWEYPEDPRVDQDPESYFEQAIEQAHGVAFKIENREVATVPEGVLIRTDIQRGLGEEWNLFDPDKRVQPRRKT